MQRESLVRVAATSLGVQHMTKQSQHSFHRMLLCSVAITTMAMAAHAQPAPATAPAADADTGKVEKVTVTAQKRKQNAQDVPGTVNAINGKNIKDLGITSSDRIAQYVPGVSINLPKYNNGMEKGRSSEYILIYHTTDVRPPAGLDWLILLID